MRPHVLYFTYMHAPPRSSSTNFRLEEQLAKTNLAAENSRGARTLTPKRGRSPSRSPDHNRNNRFSASRTTRRSRERRPQAISPQRDTKRRRTNKSMTEAQQSFQSGARGTEALSACTICLGRHPHDVYNCSATNLWDGTPARCQKNDKGRLINPTGNIICSDWQKPNSCAATTHDSRHECSGCGKQTHGAQRCPRAQKA